MVRPILSEAPLELHVSMAAKLCGGGQIMWQAHYEEKHLLTAGLPAGAGRNRHRLAPEPLSLNQGGDFWISDQDGTFFLPLPMQIPETPRVVPKFENNCDPTRF